MVGLNCAGMFRPSSVINYIADIANVIEAVDRCLRVHTNPGRGTGGPRSRIRLHVDRGDEKRGANTAKARREKGREDETNELISELRKLAVC